VTPEAIKQTISVGMHWVGDRFKGLGISELAQVETGEGQLVTINGEKIAAYRDEKGVIHAISAVCPHLGCILAWNNAEKSWDCPCHGSRFGCDGDVLHGPAITDLKVYPESTATK
jgi:Rieske Fe-S protein